MSVQRYSQKRVCSAHWGETARAVAERMQRRGVGCVVVMRGDRPRALLSDRDLALGALRPGVDVSALAVGDLVERPCATLPAGASLARAAARMGSKGVRRLPLVDETGVLAGIVSHDDLAGLFISELEGLSAALAAQSSEAGAGLPGLRRESGSPTEHYWCEVVRTSPGTAVPQLVETLREREVGSLLIVEGERPLGIVTDRDLMVRVLAAPDLDPGALTAREVMSTPLHSAASTDPIERIVDIMADAGIRRVPVLREGRLVGIVSLDDLLVTFSEELYQLARGVRAGARRARRRARSRAVARGARAGLRQLRARVARATEALRLPGAAG